MVILDRVRREPPATIIKGRKGSSLGCALGFTLVTENEKGSVLNVRQSEA